MRNSLILLRAATAHAPSVTRCGPPDDNDIAIRILSSGFAADEECVNQIPDAHGERNEAESGGGERFAFGRDLCNCGKRRHIADCTTDAQNAPAPGTADL